MTTIANQRYLPSRALPHNAIMELIDNLIMLAIPGAMDAGLDTLLFWGSLALALLLAGVAAFPINRWLIAHGRGHAVVHAHHAA